MNINAFFSGSKPNIINEKTIKKLDELLSKTSQPTTITDHMTTIFEDYIRPNLLAILVAVAITIFLSIRYLIKQMNNEMGEFVNKPIVTTNNGTLNGTINNTINDTTNHFVNPPIDGITDKYNNTMTDDTISSLTDDTDDNFNDNLNNNFNDNLNNNFNDNDDYSKKQYEKELIEEKNKKTLFNKLAKMIFYNPDDESNEF